MRNNLKYHFICPFCKQGEVLSDGRAKVIISVQCPRCRRFFLADLDTLKTEKAAAQRRKGRVKR